MQRFGSTQINIPILFNIWIQNQLYYERILSYCRSTNIYGLIAKINQTLTSEISLVFGVRYSKQNISLLSLLYQRNYLYSYLIKWISINKQKNILFKKPKEEKIPVIIVYTRYSYQFGGALQQLKLISRPSRLISCSIKNIALLVSRKRSHCTYCIKIGVNIYSINECLLIKRGGTILCLAE